MVVQVEIDRFAQEVSDRLGLKEALVCAKGSGVFVSAGDPVKNLIICSWARRSEGDVWRALSEAGLKLGKGSWLTEASELDMGAPSDISVAAVAYRSIDQKPGIWVDVYPTLPTPAEVLLKMFEEFKDTGDLGDVPFEEFMALANPNVVVMTADEVRFHADQKTR